MVVIGDEHMSLNEFSETAFIQAFSSRARREHVFVKVDPLI